VCGVEGDQRLAILVPKEGHLWQEVRVYQLLRLGKWLGVLMLVSGTVTAFMATQPEARRRAVFWLVFPGLGVSWLFGFLLALRMDVSLLSLWVWLSIVFSVFSTQFSLFAVVKPERKKPVLALLALLSLLACLLLMVWKPSLPRKKH
jgi:hypothetical protein